MTVDITSTSPKRYCEYCGLQLIATRVNLSFDFVTGEPDWEILYTCKNKTFLSWHTKVRTYKNGAKYIGGYD